MNHIDLTQRPPRSVRVRLGGYVILPRMLDKCRATIAGKNGEYHYDCSMDRHFLRFTGIHAEALKAEVATGKSDSEILAWIETNASSPRSAWEIVQWSSYHETRGPDSDAETLLWYAEKVGEFSKTREDIKGFADLLDLDDYCTFGGQP